MKVIMMLVGLSGVASGVAAQGTTFVVVHGAWGGGWAWGAVDSMVTAAGHAMHRPTLTGLGERVHLATPDTDLSTHVLDVVNHLVFERLDDVVLVGHSYGGMVVMGVADRVPDRVRRIILVDAFLPADGESVLDASRGTPIEPLMARSVADADPSGRMVPSWLDPEAPWPTDVPHPVRTFKEPIALSGVADDIPGTYILTVAPTADPAGDHFAAFAERARLRGWDVRILRSDHNPQNSAREALVALLLEVIGR